MRRFLYNIIAAIILPLLFVLVLLYAMLSILQLLFRTINLQINKVMIWVDKNITPYIGQCTLGKLIK